MKSRMLVSLLVIALAAAVIGGATMAWFTDADESAPVTFTAGTLLIDIDKFDFVNTNEINLDILNPGDEWGYKVDVKNSGTKNFIYKVLICWQDILGNTLVDFGGREGFGTDPLSDAIVFTVKKGNEIITEGTLKGKNSPLGFEIGQLAPGATDSYTIEAVLPTTAGNEYQGSKMKLAFVVMAKQIQDGAAYGEFECPLLDLFPSTNLLNKQKNAPRRPGEDAPYVELVSATGDSVTLNFVNPNDYNAVFEVRIDGEGLTSTPHWAASYPFIDDDEKVYEPYFVVTNESSQKTFNVDKKVEVRLAAGAESDFYFDWTPFYVVGQ